MYHTTSGYINGAEQSRFGCFGVSRIFPFQRGFRQALVEICPSMSPRLGNWQWAQQPTASPHLFAARRFTGLPPSFVRLMSLPLQERVIYCSRQPSFDVEHTAFAFQTSASTRKEKCLRAHAEQKNHDGARATNNCPLILRKSR